MPIGSVAQTFDKLLQLKDAGLIAADGAAQVGGSAKVVDLGAAPVRGTWINQYSAVEVASGDEAYRVMLQASNDNTFATGVVLLALDHVGNETITGASADTAANERHELPFSNEVNGTVYRYVRVYVDVTGTIATGVNFVSYLAKNL